VKERWPSVIYQLATPLDFCFFQEEPFDGAHAPDLLTVVKKFTNHREYAQLRSFDYEALSAAMAAYPLLFRNKGCSRYSVWGKVTTRPFDESLIAGLLDLAGNAAKLAGGYRAVKQRFTIDVRKNVIRLGDLSGEIKMSN
jgi:hypothetical protein